MYKTLKSPKKKIKVMINLCEINLCIKISLEVIAIILVRFLKLNFRMRDKNEERPLPFIRHKCSRVRCSDFEHIIQYLQVENWGLARFSGRKKVPVPISQCF